jgi:hypothetical protein
MNWIIYLGPIFGGIGLLLAIIQTVRLGRNKKRDYRRYWDIAKTAHIVMGHVEAVKGGLDGIYNLPRGVSVSWGQAHEAAKQLVRFSLQNIFLHGKKFNQKEIEYFKSTGLLSGYFLIAFTEMLLDPPKELKNNETKTIGVPPEKGDL